MSYLFTAVTLKYTEDSSLIVSPTLFDNSIVLCRIFFSLEGMGLWVWNFSYVLKESQLGSKLMMFSLLGFMGMPTDTRPINWPVTKTTTIHQRSLFTTDIEANTHKTSYVSLSPNETHNVTTKPITFREKNTTKDCSSKHEMRLQRSFKAFVTGRKWQYRSL